MIKTQEQMDADRALEDAVDQCCKAYGILDDPELGVPQMRGDFIAVVEGLKFDEQGDLEYDFHGLLFPHGNLSTSKSKGLLYQGLHLLDHGTRPNE